MFSATSWASVSGFLISMMSSATCLPRNASTSFFSASTPAPPLPMTMPGLAVNTLTCTFEAVR